MDRIVRIDMAGLSSRVEPVPATWAGLGGRALTSTIVVKEVSPICHPLGPSNKLVFAPGLLSGTAAANSGRLSVGAKSPLTGGIKECNAGGTAARMFARLGIKALIIEGIPAEDKWYAIHVSKDSITIAEENELLGRGNHCLINNVQARCGKPVGVISVGPVGEMKMLSATISVADSGSRIRSLGRGGLGAVMGAKKIKFISIDDTGTPPVMPKDAVRFKAAARRFAKTLLDHPVRGQGLPTPGVDVLVNILNEAGGLPTRQLASGQFAAPDKISGQTLRAAIVERGGMPTHGCHAGCRIPCSPVYNDRNGKHLTPGFDCETLRGLGANCRSADPDDLAEAERIMDDLGCDRVETAVMFGVAMEAGVLPIGDGKEMLRLLRDEIGRGTPLGRVLGGGAAQLGRIYGLTRVPVVKNQGIPACDPRSDKGIGVACAMGTTGADHLSGHAISTNICNLGAGLDPLSKVGQVERARHLQIATAAIDSTGMCLFIAFPALDIAECLASLIDMINARFGIGLRGDDIIALGKSVLKIEHQFNLDAGLSREHDRLPEFFSQESLPPHNAIWDFTPAELDVFWDF